MSVKLTMSTALIPTLAAIENIAVSRRYNTVFSLAALMTVSTSRDENAGLNFFLAAGREVRAALKSLQAFIESKYSHKYLSEQVTLSMLALC